jgi:hypothetical protein
MLGPPGLCAAVHALRHFVSWKHPSVKLSECLPWEAAVVYTVSHHLHCFLPAFLFVCPSLHQSVGRPVVLSPVAIGGSFITVSSFVRYHICI